MEKEPKIKLKKIPKDEIYKDTFDKMAVHSCALYHAGISLRLLATLLGTSNYRTV
jgi:hypothetical protein